MRTLVYLTSLFLSLPNLLAGLALAVLRHTFNTRNPFLILLHFFQGVIWAVPVAAAVVIILLMAGCFRETRGYAAISCLLLNIGALAFVLIRVGVPPHLDQVFVFLPVLLALAGFGWLAWLELSPPASPSLPS